jgi:ABC-type bacteriocin/lantibiotic exporter with double-glycine peptidase domain
MNVTAWRYYARAYRGRYAALSGAVLGACGQSLLVLPLVLIVRRIFDSIIPGRQFSLLALAAGAMFLLNLANGALSLWIRSVSLRITKIVIRQIRNDMVDRLYSLPRMFYDNCDRSILHATIVQDTERVDVMSNALVAMALPSALVSFVLCAVLVYLNPVLFGVMACVAPPLYAASRVMGHKVRDRMNQFRRSFDSFSKGILHVLQTMDLTRIQTAEPFESGRQKNRIEELRVTSGSMAWLESAYGLVQSTISVVGSILILIVGGVAVGRGSMSIGDLLAFYVTVSLLSGCVRNILTSVPQIIMGNESLGTLYGLIASRNPPVYQGSRQVDFSGSVVFDSVHFAYKERPVLAGLSMEIEPRSTVAIIGPNGSGKSTIAYLIAGLYRPQQGRILVDGIPYEEADLISLRSSMGFVMQDPILFSGTILENIAYGRPETALEHVVEAAELATADEFIRAMPDGYQTQTGDNGVKLSGGQRQRIAIARALLRRPRLLILDEPTNHLDVEAVHGFLRNLAAMKQRPATLIISHDMEVVRHSDRVYALEGGCAIPRVPVHAHNL